jgi:hypothetical protein
VVAVLESVDAVEVVLYPATVVPLSVDAVLKYVADVLLVKADPKCVVDVSRVGEVELMLVAAVIRSVDAALCVVAVVSRSVDVELEFEAVLRFEGCVAMSVVVVLLAVLWTEVVELLFLQWNMEWIWVPGRQQGV